MAIFTASILKSTTQDESLIAQRWAKFQNFLAKTEFAKSVKEEKYQDGFLHDVFEECLGYTLDSTNPQNFNLEREKKNETDGKKADGVIYLNDEIIGVIELKDQKTKNLGDIEAQAFNYHNSHSKSRYIVISNFDELRFYIDKKTAYEKFNLFTLSYEEFKKLHLLLSFEGIKDGVALTLKEKSANFEAQISKQLYRDFSAFRTHLFENIVKNNDLDKSLLLRLTQKLCDRIIFILFAEDRGLLRHNTIKEIREEFKAQKFTSYTLYDIYKFYFDAINQGNEKLGVPKYNGGLFAKDETLDALVIEDAYLDMEAQKLSDYDFMSDIGVNILGHIFEQSLTDLEEINASINDTEFDSKKSKRKKDGVFYTPEYITKYIVDNTLGKLCHDKRQELKLTDITPPANPKKPTKQEQTQKENLEEYRNYLLNLKILDPACGSGAFLNQALDFLIREHESLQKDLVIMGDITAYYEIEKSILEHNLYGVDINEDAVEIAKLSLWLRTAQKGRCLTNLNDKIVCANSLLDMPFDEGSFDVVIGNPPYVRQESIKEQKEALSKIYKVANGTADLYVYFYELAFKMLKNDRAFGFICSNKFFRAKYGENLRELILNNMTIEEIADFNGVKIFEDATVDSAITIFKKQIPNQNHQFKVLDEKLEKSSLMKQSDLSKSNFSFSNPKELAIKQKIEARGTPLKEWDINIYRGITTGCNEAFIINLEQKNFLVNQDKNIEDIIKPILRGRVLDRFKSNLPKEYLIYIPWEYDISSNKIVENYLLKFKDILSNRPEVKQNRYNWYVMSRYGSAYSKAFNNPKIIYPEFSSTPLFSYDDKGSYLLDTSWFIDCGDKYLLALLNSKIIWHYLGYISSSLGSASLRMKKIFVERIPIPKIDEEKQQPFIKLVDEILEAKQKIKDYKALHDEAIKTDNFDREIKLKKELESLENIVTSNEKIIDEMVYKLYDLTDDEIKIVEG